MTWIEKWAGNNRAKPRKFRQHLNPPDNKFELDYVLEAADLRIAIQNSPSDKFSLYNNSTNSRRQRAISFSLAKVVDKKGSRVRLRHLGTDDRNDIWMMVDSDLIRPYPSGKELTVPFGFMNSHSVWNRMVNRVDKEEKIAPKEWFQPHPKDPGGNMFQIGEKLEAVDRRNAQLICPATIGDIKDNFVLVSFDGWSGTFDYWANYNSQDLFPVGWCSKAKYRLQSPGPNYEITEDAYSEDRAEYSVPNKLQKTLKRRQTCPEMPKNRSAKFKPTVIVVEVSPDKASIHSPDNDSDCTHMCTTDDESKPVNRVVTAASVAAAATNNSGLFAANQNKKEKMEIGIKSKSKAFRNIFKMWTEKNSFDFVQEKVDERKCDEVDVDSKDDGYKSSGDIWSLKTVTDEDSTKVDRSNLTSSMEKMSDTNSDVVIVQPQKTSFHGTYGTPHALSLSPVSNTACRDDLANLTANNNNRKLSLGNAYDHKPVSPSSCSFESSPLTGSSVPKLLSDPAEWTIEDVRTYLIKKNPTLESVANEFKVHEIDGQALLLLSMNTMRQYMKIKLGPAIKVENIIKNLLERKV